MRTAVSSSSSAVTRCARPVGLGGPGAEECFQLGFVLLAAQPFIDHPDDAQNAVTRLLRQAQETGLAGGGIDARTEAMNLLAMTDHLTPHPPHDDNAPRQTLRRPTAPAPPSSVRRLLARCPSRPTAAPAHRRSPGRPALRDPTRRRTAGGHRLPHRRQPALVAETTPPNCQEVLPPCAGSRAITRSGTLCPGQPRDRQDGAVVGASSRRYASP